MRRTLLALLTILTFSCGGYTAMKSDKAIFAGGCFWCIEAAFDSLNGVIKVTSGYTGGKIENPTYEQVCSGKTGHFEAVEVTYDPTIINYETLLDTFWRSIDPTDPDGQFADKGSQYKTAIFYFDAQQKVLAENSKTNLNKSGKFDKPVATKILPAAKFYPAEEYHQNYSKNNEEAYNRYAVGSGRKAYCSRVWGTQAKPVPQTCEIMTDEQLKKKLSPLQYEVTKKNGTEKPFQNEYWNNHKEGIYVDIISGEPLFASSDKFDSGTGWPSFSKPINKESIAEQTDATLGMERTEIRSKKADSHLGHVFNDGPKPAGKRYCINSAALRFIAKEDMTKEGYVQYLELFKNKEPDRK